MSLDVSDIRPYVRDAAILGYLEKKPKINTSNILSASVVKTISHTETLSKEEFSLAHKDIKGLHLVNACHNAEVTQEQAKDFQESLGFGKSLRKTLDTPVYAFYDAKINGKTLYAGEQSAIFIYASFNYLLINGVLSNDATSIEMWCDKRFGKPQNKLTPEEKATLEAAIAEVPKIVEMAASGMNKLSDYEGTLYRGDAMPPDAIKKWEAGKILITEKFFSCSTDASVGESFSRQNAIDYMAHTKEEYKPVVYVFESKTSKDITEYVDRFVADEEERTYLPGQAFRTTGVDEKTVPGLAIIYLEEMSLET